MKMDPTKFAALNASQLELIARARTLAEQKFAARAPH